jgi:hypothetical protein
LISGKKNPPHPFLISHAAALPFLWLSVSACPDKEDAFPVGLDGELEMHLATGLKEGGGSASSLERLKTEVN